MEILSRLHETIKRYSFTDYALVKAEKPLSLSVYQQWLKDSHQAQMTYLEEHQEQKQHLNRLLPSCRSALVVIENYYPHPKSENFPFKNQKIAKYAQGEDYHHWLQQKLNHLIKELEQLFPEHQFLACTDSKPVLERDLAYRAGLGWFGKNSCLINQKKGSFFFIGEVLTTLDLEVENQVHPDLCGTCNRCVEACPTEALLANRTLDANKCISFWNIESKTPAPKDLRPAMGDWLFGCDICQEVCPWNQKVFNSDFAHRTNSSEDVEGELRWLLTSSNKHIEKTLAHTPLSRARGKGLKRSAMIVAANLKLSGLAPEISTYTQHESLGEVATWALAELQ